MLVEAAQIVPSDRRAVTIKEFENPDGDLAAIVQPVAQLRDNELPVGRGSAEFGDDLDQFVKQRELAPPWSDRDRETPGMSGYSSLSPFRPRSLGSWELP